MKVEIGTLIARVEAPTVRYRVTSRLAKGVWRCLPFQARGREVVLQARIDGNLTGDGSVWIQVPK